MERLASEDKANQNNIVSIIVAAAESRVHQKVKKQSTSIAFHHDLERLVLCVFFESNLID